MTAKKFLAAVADRSHIVVRQGETEEYVNINDGKKIGWSPQRYLAIQFTPSAAGLLVDRLKGQGITATARKAF